MRRPPGTAEALLTCLPGAEDDGVIEEVRLALVAVSYADGKADPALVRALQDEAPLRRALAMHAALLPTGQVLYFGGNERSEKQHNAGPGGWNHACIWTPDDGHVDAIPSPGFDLFCCGHCFLGSGQLLIVGGTEAYSKQGGPGHAAHGHSPGVRNAALFDAALIDQVWHNEQVASPAQPGTGWTGWYAHGIAADRAKRLLVVQHDDGRLHAFMIGIDDVFEARIASGSVISSNCRKTSVFTFTSSVTASTTRSAVLRASISVAV